MVVLDGTRLDAFDVETSTKKQDKGNIYLAKVVRVEPSLQAAFVDYGGNRHGFLAFSEIHPDYYQIPIADRKALIDEVLSHHSDEDDEVVQDNNDTYLSKTKDKSENLDGLLEKIPTGKNDSSYKKESTETDSNPLEQPSDVAPLAPDTSGVVDLGGDDAEQGNDDDNRRRFVSSRRYKIQEVIKRRQVLLVQVVKEERGTKGAALTTYLSLAGRYCVLMPNSSRGGGVSRKITNGSDRRRLKAILTSLGLSKSMAVILRTAGGNRSKAEIKRDFEYLQRTWNNIRELTMQSRAPSLIHEEANLIRRSIRDVYTRDIEEIHVEGEEGYKTAKDFMKTLTPSHAKKVKRYRDQTIPLFHRYQVESQLDAMHSPAVQLKSGGSIVFGETEALVAIDVNSGKATKERHIEETALKTNIEAANEIARQLRLRDLAGLIVIDFIDMDEHRNNHAVERKLKDALKSDRARIQCGRISHFGLLELSRQRLRPSLMETNFQSCRNCSGTGVVRSVESTAIQTLRLIEEEGLRRRSDGLKVYVNPDVAPYILNSKRAVLSAIEEKYGLTVLIYSDQTIVPPGYRIERTKSVVSSGAELKTSPDRTETIANEDEATKSEENTETNKRKRRRRRRRRRPETDVQVSNSGITTASKKNDETPETLKTDGNIEKPSRTIAQEENVRSRAEVVEFSDKTTVKNDAKKSPRSRKPRAAKNSNKISPPNVEPLVEAPGHDTGAVDTGAVPDSHRDSTEESNTSSRLLRAIQRSAVAIRGKGSSNSPPSRSGAETRSEGVTEETKLEKTQSVGDETTVRKSQPRRGWWNHDSK